MSSFDGLSSGAYSVCMTNSTPTKNYLCRDINGDVHIVDQTELVQRTSVYALLWNEQGLLLVCDRSRSDEKWDLPGGGVEQGESLTDALKREVDEETKLALDGNPEKICEFTEYFYDVESQKGWESTRHFYKVRFSGAPRLDGNGDDIAEARYFVPPFDVCTVAPVAREVATIAGL